MEYNELYIEELSHNRFSTEFLNYKNICISGATGLIGSYLIDFLLINNNFKGKIYALVRNVDSATIRFSKFLKDSRLIFVKYSLESYLDIDDEIDFIVHAASLTDPINYSLHPVETMKVNIFGLNYLLSFAKEKNARFLFLSSCEVYGNNIKRDLSENEYGYVDILDTRSSYNEAKRCCETFCASYAKEYSVNITILRLSRVFGPTMKLEDTKAISQFIKNSLNGENIVLKSKGDQLFNYTYVSDVIGAILSVFRKTFDVNTPISFNFTNTELHNLKEIASFCSQLSNTSVVYDLPSSVEKRGYSKAVVSSMSCKLFNEYFDFIPQVTLFEGISRTYKILKGEDKL